MSHRVERMVLSGDREIDQLVRLGILTRSQIPRTAPSAETRATLRRMRRINREPLPAARRQIECLVKLLDGQEFRELTFSRDKLLARVTPLPIQPDDKPIESFRIGFVPLSRIYFPMVTRLDASEGPRYVFQRLGGHGDCWGQARPLLEKALEEADVYNMFLIAFTWALRNLPKEDRKRVTRVTRTGRAIRLPYY